MNHTHKHKIDDNPQRVAVPGKILHLVLAVAVTLCFPLYLSNAAAPTFSANYPREKVSHILFDIFAHFDDLSSESHNFIALNHYNVPIAIEFDQCELSKCLSDLGLNHRIHDIPNRGFRAFRFAGNQPVDGQQKWKRLQEITRTATLKPFYLSAREAPLPLVIFKLLQNIEIKLLISNGIKGTVSLHLANQNPLQVLHLLMVYYDLEIQERGLVYTLIPGEDLGSAGYRVPSAP